MTTRVEVAVTLGRDGLGGGSEEDFDTWVSYVQDKLDERVPFEVTVEAAHTRDVQENQLKGDESHKETVQEALNVLWDEYCAAPVVTP